ncbi:c-type cytochrome [Novosphingobium sp. ZN18A2]|uniref:c-type cytochrome n=1 Tax=Novosphingobium sp. ZN18A2 TaxID=3079861 RepID=UPI0030CCB25A
MRHTTRLMTAVTVSLAAMSIAGCSGKAPDAQATAAAAAAAEASAMPAEEASAAPESYASASAAAEPAAPAPTPTAKPAPSPTPSASATPLAKASAKPNTNTAPKPESTPSPAAKVADAEPLAPPKSFARCAVCHNAAKGAAAKIGPNLWGVYGTKAGEIAGYNFSDALKASGLTWNEAALDNWIEAPMKDVPGTYMSFPGIKDPAKRAEIIAYLKSAR